MSPPDASARCLNCGSAEVHEWCPRCGERAWRGRVSLGRVSRDVASTLVDVDSRYVRTIRELTVSPGRVVRDVISGRTVPYVSPVRYLVLVAAVVTVASIASGVSDSWSDPFGTLSSDPRLGKINEALTKWMNVFLMGIVPILAIVTRLVFRRSRLNFAEHVVFNAYVTSQQTLFYLPFIPLLAWNTPARIAGSCAYFVGSLAYYAWACGDFFGGDRLLSAAWGLASYGVALLLYLLCVVLVVAALVSAA